ncbi:hypothetical protein R3P38DRAFT_1844823 [Favolaschia claudopus]|uniref:Uncharacterized protein n=1 Tax=Favolaschia claudopus TaxID=2862362 RepID=A0AAW0A2P6_9AGAR
MCAQSLRPTRCVWHTSRMSRQPSQSLRNPTPKSTSISPLSRIHGVVRAFAPSPSPRAIACCCAISPSASIRGMTFVSGNFTPASRRVTSFARNGPVRLMSTSTTLLVSATLRSFFVSVSARHHHRDGPRGYSVGGIGWLTLPPTHIRGSVAFSCDCINSSCVSIQIWGISFTKTTAVMTESKRFTTSDRRISQSHSQLLLAQSRRLLSSQPSPGFVAVDPHHRLRPLRAGRGRTARSLLRVCRTSKFTTASEGCLPRPRWQQVGQHVQLHMVYYADVSSGTADVDNSGW